MPSSPASLGPRLERLEREAVAGCRPASRKATSAATAAADMRYVGQSWDLRVPIPTGRSTPGAVARLRRDFDALHERAYGYASPDAPVETVHLAISVSAPAGADGGVDGRAPRGAPAGSDPAPGDRTAEPVGHRPAYVDGTDGLTDVAVYDAAALQPGDRLDGPALVDGADSTTYVASGFAVPRRPASRPAPASPARRATARSALRRAGDRPGRAARGRGAAG